MTACLVTTSQPVRVTVYEWFREILGASADLKQHQAEIQAICRCGMSGERFDINENVVAYFQEGDVQLVRIHHAHRLLNDDGEYVCKFPNLDQIADFFALTFAKQAAAEKVTAIAAANTTVNGRHAKRKRRDDDCPRKPKPRRKGLVVWCSSGGH